MGREGGGGPESPISPSLQFLKLLPSKLGLELSLRVSAGLRSRVCTGDKSGKARPDPQQANLSFYKPGRGVGNRDGCWGKE